MDGSDRRKDIRIETTNLISHASVDDKGRIVSQCMGKAINISRSGILLETPRSIDSERLLLMTVDQDDNLIEMTGRLVYCKQAASGMYHAGVKFIGSDEEISRFTVKLIKLYHRRKHSLLIQASL